MIKKTRAPFKILIADDDFDDLQMIKDCFTDIKLPILINEVYDGQFLIDHLKADTNNLPQLILLDINMPRKNGFEVLEELKHNDRFRKIPVIMFSTSEASHDIEKAYQLGANCFVSKPDSIEEWCDKMSKLGKFWVECVRVSV